MIDVVRDTGLQREALGIDIERCDLLHIGPRRRRPLDMLHPRDRLRFIPGLVFPIVLATARSKRVPIRRSLAAIGCGHLIRIGRAPRSVALHERIGVCSIPSLEILADLLGMLLMVTPIICALPIGILVKPRRLRAFGA